MPRPRTSETRQRILDAALELFLEQGVQQTSLRQIADRLGLTKPALYYHFSSREDLLNSLLQPLVADIDSVLAEDEHGTTSDPRDLLGRYFDVSYRHHALTTLMLHDLPTLNELGYIDQVLTWRRRLVAVLAGPNAGVAERARAIVALGGLADCLVLLDDVPEHELRAAALDAACAALGSTSGSAAEEQPR
ncbi:TetR family transcriptional regulator [Tamaricihabitans halophyticus]|uniref:TetR family transcriptional regulator n=1 Tax=Tamaricihabitans halophyticus TaxID=1262583 RepID=A0A4R2Q9F4_9PSEU|nr:TetR/AcrR family transcriptional regulator [Tamaricihabitans halophyticus]TCP43431.1 TetR family transcriptional regulator [Tamaricihabitans halophyticus]